ncbi:unnamed protein product [Chrysoparadoxa australica]
MHGIDPTEGRRTESKEWLTSKGLRALHQCIKRDESQKALRTMSQMAQHMMLQQPKDGLPTLTKGNQSPFASSGAETSCSALGSKASNEEGANHCNTNSRSATLEKPSGESGYREDRDKPFELAWPPSQLQVLTDTLNKDFQRHFHHSLNVLLPHGGQSRTVKAANGPRLKNAKAPGTGHNHHLSQLHTTTGQVRQKNESSFIRTGSAIVARKAS